MKILFYNWIQFDDLSGCGGGVNVYQKNLIEKMLEIGGYEIYFISSGTAYNFFTKRMYIERTDNIFGKKVNTYQIVNSPIMAPGQNVVSQLDEYINDTSILELLDKFISVNGKFDVIHFNNIEGISAQTLNIKNKYPEIKIIISMHNYYLVCPQVNLWQCENINCLDSEKGFICDICLNCHPNIKKQYYVKCIDYIVKRICNSNESILWQEYCYIKQMLRKLKAIFSKNDQRVIPLELSLHPTIFDDFRRKNIELVNANVDVVLAVSKRTAEIARLFGINNNILRTEYIGTKVAENQFIRKPKIKKKSLNIAYMGYMRKDKGFYFFVNALKRVPKEIAKNINLLIATKKNNEEKHKLIIRELTSMYEKVTIKYDYNHSEIEDLLKDIDIGVVPVLWEDNLPQVAIEMKANGIPLLCSDGGGACELSKATFFKYEKGNYEEFVNKIIFIFENREILNTYWYDSMELVSMDRHIEILEKIYRK